MTLLICLLLAAAPDAARGKQLFQSCSGCHNTDSDVRKTGPSLRSLFGKVTLRNGRHVDDENVRSMILDGYNGMPSFRYSFRQTEVDDLMAYLHTLTAKPSGTPGSQADGYFKAYCIRCHNPDSRSSAGPDLHGRFKPESVELIDEGHAGAPPLKDWLDEPARRALIEYLKAY
jgi:cytochrome c2